MTSINPTGAGSTNGIDSGFSSSTSSSPTLTGFSSTDSLSSSSGGINSLSLDAIPSLETPSVSIGTFFSVVNSTIREFQNQLSTADLIDQITRTKFVNFTGSQSRNIAAIVDLLGQKIVEKDNNTNQAVNRLDNMLKERNNAVNQQRFDIDNNNTLIPVDANNVNNWNNAATNLRNSLTGGSIVRNRGAFPYDVEWKFNPPATQAQANAVNPNISALNNAGATLATYINNRNAGVNTYNSLANTYNSKVTTFNNEMTSFINQYNLSGAVSSKGYNLYVSAANTQSHLSVKPFYGDYAQMTKDQVYVSTPDANMTSNLSAISQIPAYPTTNAEQFRTNIHDSEFSRLVAPVLDLLSFTLIMWSFTSSLMAYNPPQDTTPDPMRSLAAKSVVSKLLPEAFIDQMREASTQTKDGKVALAFQVAGLGSSAVDQIMAKAVLSQLTNEIHLRISDLNRGDNLSKIKNPDKLVQNVQILAADLIGASALKATFPALGALSSLDPARLTPNNPGVSVTLGVSFANRVTELINTDTTKLALEQLIDSSPELANLTPTEKAALVEQLLPAFNLALSNVAIALLAQSLGISNLLPQLLAQAGVPIDLLTQIVSQAKGEQAQGLSQLEGQIAANLIAQGINPTEAQFLAKFATDLMAAGLLSPLATSVSSSTIQKELLVNSLASLLIFEGFSLTKALAIAQKAVNQVLNAGPFASVEQFNKALERALKNQGLGKLASPLAEGAILLPASVNPEAVGKKGGGSIGASNLIDKLPALPPDTRMAIQEGKMGDPKVKAKVQADLEESFIKQGYSAQDAKAMASTLVTFFSKGKLVEEDSNEELLALFRKLLQALLAGMGIPFEQAMQMITAAIEELKEKGVQFSSEELESGQLQKQVEEALIKQGLSPAQAQILVSVVMDQVLTRSLQQAEAVQEDIKRSEIKRSEIRREIRNELREEVSRDLQNERMIVPPPILEPNMEQEATIQPIPTAPITPSFKPEEKETAPIEPVKQPKPRPVENQEEPIRPAPSPERNEPPPPLETMDEKQLMELINMTLHQVLVPSLGKDLAEKITVEVAKTLFGNPNPDAYDKADVKRPNSLVQTIGNQVRLLHIDQNEERKEKLAESFKETIKTSIDLYSSLKKLLDPAYFILATLNPVSGISKSSAFVRGHIDIAI